MYVKDPFNPDLDEIAAYAQKKSGKTMYDFLVYIGGMSKSDYVDYMHKHEQEITKKAKKSL